MTQQEIRSHCHTCRRRSLAEKNSDALLARLWRWHTGWCPGWKAYERELKRKGMQVPDVRARMDA